MDSESNSSAGELGCPNSVICLSVEIRILIVVGWQPHSRLHECKRRPSDYREYLDRESVLHTRTKSRSVLLCTVEGRMFTQNVLKKNRIEKARTRVRNH